MPSPRRVRATSAFVLRIGSVALGAALALGACSDTPTSSDRDQQGGAAGASEGGERSARAGRPAGGRAGDSAAEGGGSTSGEGGGGTQSTGADAGSSGAGAVPDEGISLDDFCELRTRAREWLRQCRFSFGDSSGWWGSANIDRFCSSGRAAIDAGRLVYDPLRAAECAALSVGGCDAIEAFAFGVGDPQSGFLRSDACVGVVVGAVQLGQPCHADSQRYANECGEGFCSTNTCPGECTAYSEIDGPCDGTSSKCDPAAAYCNAQNECSPWPALGEVCSAADCAPGLACRSDGDSGSCVAPVPVGDDCDAALDVCVEGALCYEGECVTEVPLGEPCEGDAQCSTSGYCNETCQARVALSGDCSGGQQCVQGAVCVEGACRLYGQDGEDCPCDTGLWCDADNRCRPPFEQGADCTQPSDDSWQARCATPLVCVPSAFVQDEPTAYACQPPGGVGDFCVPQYLGTCQVPLFCNVGTLTCLEPAGEGGPCNFAFPRDSCQAGLHCVCSSGCATPHTAQASCQPQLADGEECTTPSECASGWCDGEQHCAPPAACE